MKFCCAAMATQVQQECTMHPDPADCPDALVGRFGRRYGIRIHDGGDSFVLIRYCPWCGTKLSVRVGPDGDKKRATRRAV